MMMNCMDAGVGALTVAGIRLADVGQAVAVLLLVLLAAILAISVARFGVDVARRFNSLLRSRQTSSQSRVGDL